MGAVQAPVASEAAAYRELLLDPAARTGAVHLHEAPVLPHLQDRHHDAGREEGRHEEEMANGMNSPTRAKPQKIPSPASARESRWPGV